MGVTMATKKSIEPPGKHTGAKKPVGKVRTQMVGEAPGEDLGYDPDTIPTEPIEDDDDE
jgi:hypothetical protein